MFGHRKLAAIRTVCCALILLYFVGPLSAQEKSDPTPVAFLPERYTITYTVVGRDIRTKKMRESAAQSDKAYYDRQIRDGAMTVQAGTRAMEQSRKTILAVAPLTTREVTLSSDGAHLLCISLSKEGNDDLVGIFSAEENKTYSWVTNKFEGKRISIYDSFNFSQMRCMPLLAFNHEKAGLFFLKNAKLVPASSTTAEPLALEGMGPLVYDFHVDSIKEIPYVSSQVNLRKEQGNQEPGQVVQYVLGRLCRQWKYTHYAPALGIVLPGSITLRICGAYIMDGVAKNLPETEYRYSLVSAKPDPMERSAFDIQTWAKKEPRVVVSDTSHGQNRVFAYMPSHQTLQEASVADERSTNAQGAKN